jgi:hypothetical protein
MKYAFQMGSGAMMQEYMQMLMNTGTQTHKARRFHKPTFIRYNKNILAAFLLVKLFIWKIPGACLSKQSETFAYMTRSEQEEAGYIRYEPERPVH